jgi:Protein of unknown function (DUF1559)
MINFSLGYHDGVNKSAFPPGGIAMQRISVLLCPSDINDRLRTNSTTGEPEHYPLSYGLSVGEYLIYNPVTRQTGGAAFGANASTSDRDVTDGLSNTLAMSEVRAFTPRIQDATLGATTPSTAAEALAGMSGGSFGTTGHTEWVCGRALHNGFTTTLGPNTVIPWVSGGQTLNIDLGSSREGRTATDMTYGVIVSRSYHTGVVNSLLLDGSVRSISDNIDLTAWRNLGARADGQVIGEF